VVPNIESAEYVGGYTIRLRFSDGVIGDLNLENELWGEVFAPLKDLKLFSGFWLDSELNTIAWPSGADLAPEFLYERASAQQGAPAKEATPRR